MKKAKIPKPPAPPPPPAADERPQTPEVGGGEADALLRKRVGRSSLVIPLNPGLNIPV